MGVNYYHPSRVQEPEYSSDSLAQDWRPDKYYASFNKRGVRMNADRGWEIHPQTIYEIAKRIQEDYGNISWFISENGMGVENEEHFKDEEGQIQDDYRIIFTTEHLFGSIKRFKKAPIVLVTMFGHQLIAGVGVIHTKIVMV